MQRLEMSPDANRGMSLQSQLLAPKAAPKADITVSCTAVVLNCSVLLLLRCLQVKFVLKHNSRLGEVWKLSGEALQLQLTACMTPLQ